MTTKRVLVLGATGMLGHTLVKNLDKHEDIEMFATARDLGKLGRQFEPDLLNKVFLNIDASDLDSITDVFEKVKPDVVINCIGIIKQSSLASDSIVSISINALFPHQLAAVCSSYGARLIHISTDCVFSGKKGLYLEDDFPDCKDLYGRTKLLGEVDYPYAVTLRTSIIGHELNGNVSLVDWFLSQERKVQGYTKAVYTGFPTVELAHIIAEVVIPRPELRGIYHVSSDPISKYELLRLIASEYGKVVDIEPYDEFRCDRSLDSSHFRRATGYMPPQWPELVAKMHSAWQNS